MAKSIGGNSGYIGYSESVRSQQAKLDGKFPKTLFKKEYGLTEKQFNNMLERGIIYVSEWHHTSKFGNKTQFYAIDNKILFNFLKGDKKAALEAYKKTKDYSVPIKKNNTKKESYKSNVSYKKGSEESMYLLSLNEKFTTTKRGNFTFYLNKNLLKNTKYRKYFSVNYKSNNFV